MSTNSVLRQCDWLDLEQLRGSDILVTGGTGLIGFNVLQELAALRHEYDLRLHALVRNESRARERFAAFLDRVNLVQGDVCREIQLDSKVDYIIHGASVTSSRSFVEHPVETIMTSVLGTRNLLELARAKNVKSMVYLSSMEIYGTATEQKVLTENMVGYLDPMQLRSSYPQSKRTCESMCLAYSHEYGVPVKTIRLCQTFGPGIPATDRRVIVEFINTALAGETIRIKASGDSSRMYLYTSDAVTGIMTILLKGENGLAYNLANRESYCSIRELAHTVQEIFGSCRPVLTNTGTEEERRAYPPDSYLYLDTTRVEALGWKAMCSLRDGLTRLGKELSAASCQSDAEIMHDGGKS